VARPLVLVGGCHEGGRGRNSGSSSLAPSSSASALDVVTDFLNPKIDKVVYAELPEGIDWLSESPRTGFLRLNKALYGLKQAPRLSHQSIDGFLLSIGFHKSSADHNLYIDTRGVMLLLYVDDIQLLYTESAKTRAIGVKESLMRQ